MNITDYPARVIKKGKTRGRPSKEEVFLSGVASSYLKANEPTIRQAFIDFVMNGKGVMEWKKIKL